ncbi:MAG: Rieske 2Fe-2S domain-containing protein [Acidobacteriota bacterium]
MSVGYTTVQWNRDKKVYDAVLLGGLLATIGAFAGVTAATHPGATAETLILRSTALAALLLLHVILAIGPLSRLDRRFLVLLYNRRHLGVTTFSLGLVHAALATLQYGAFGDRPAVESLLNSYSKDFLPSSSLAALANVPFEIFGAVALGFLFLLAATSHDFWNRNLGPAVWKLLHLGVIIAYASLLLHVALGVLQSESSLLYPILLGVGFVVLLGLHWAAARREGAVDDSALGPKPGPESEGYRRACAVEELKEDHGHIAVLERGAGDPPEGKPHRVAIFLHQGRVYALSNVCRHQGGPLGEGQVIDGCVTCPWHGWQYRAHDGVSPPPFTEVVPTYSARIVDGEVWVHPEPLAEGTESDGALVEKAAEEAAAEAEPFYVGYLPTPGPLVTHARRVAIALLLGVPLVAGAVGAVQHQFLDGTFEFGVVKSFEGVLVEEPLPALIVDGPTGGATPQDSLLLVGFGKQGLPDFAQGHGGSRVRFNGSLIYRGNLTMVEMNDPESFEVLGAGAPPSPAQPLGTLTLRGELVDTKCYGGVMRPAVGKVHRACAIACLRGGIPPGILVRGDAEEGEPTPGTVVLLAGPDGKSLDFDPSWAALEVEAEGELTLHGQSAVLRTRELRLTDS